MDQYTLGWLAGWLEGEGTFTAHTTKRGYTRLIVRAVSNDLDTVQRAQGRAGIGRVYGPYCYGDHTLPHWHWAVTRRQDSLDFMTLIKPHMSSRRQAQIDRAVAIGGTPK